MRCVFLLFTHHSIFLPLVFTLSSCRIYFGEHNVKAMFSVLKPFHLKMERGPETLKKSHSIICSRIFGYCSEWVSE